jgi:hypothetical protein
MLRLTVASLLCFFCALNIAQPELSPAQKISGNWIAQANFLGDAGPSNSVGRLQVVQAVVRIDPDGNMRLSAKNGCEISGLVVPSPPDYRGEVRAVGCRESSLNHLYSLTVIPVKSSIVMQLRQFSGSNRAPGHAIDGSFARYKP